MNHSISSGRSIGDQPTHRVVRYFSRLEGKLVGLFLLLSLIPLFLVGAMASYNGTQALEQHIEARLSAQAQHVMDLVEGFLASRQSSLQAWARFSVMADMAGDDPDGRITRMLMTLERESSMASPLMVVNRFGKIVAASAPQQIGGTVAADPWFRETAERFASGKSSEALDMQPVDGGFRLSTPLRLEIKGLEGLGYLSVLVTNDQLVSLIRSVQIDYDSEVDVYLAMGLGDAVASLAGEALHPLGPAETLDLVASIEQSRGKAQDSRSNGGALIALPDREPMLAGFAHSRRYPSLAWRVITTEESMSALQPIRALKRQVEWLGALISCLVVGLAIVLARRFGRPIRIIMQNAERVADGELVMHDLPVSRRDEIGSLAASFQTMTEKLQAFTEGLELKVQKRTLELEQSTARLSESEERFRLLVEQVQDYAIILLDREGRVLTWNEGAQRLKGYRSEEILSHSIACIYTEQDRAAGLLERLLTAARQSGRVTDEGWRVRKDGSQFWAEVVLTTQLDSHGQFVGFAKVTHDSTERKKAELALQASEQALTRYTQELERKNKDLELFTYVASHDLAEPLRMVSNFCGLLKRRYQGRLDADADEFIGYAVDGAARMQTLLQDLLALSRVESKAKPFQPTDCENLLAQTLANLRLLIEQHGAVVTHDSLPTLPADETQLSQVFQNLIGNAIKFHGKKPPKIHIAAVRQGEEYLFTVSDDGIGFDPKQASRIFVIFQRLHTKTEYPGTGIGLSICKKVVERHGGRIWAESTPGAGSRFFFTVPIRQAEEALSHAQAAA
jgi:PAS domain S-box-containing protein